jgi:hypothetical protein
LSHFLHARTDPRFVTTMSYRKGRSQYVSVEYYADGRWSSWGYAWAPLASNGTSTVYIGGTHQKNLRTPSP